MYQDLNKLPSLTSEERELFTNEDKIKSLVNNPLLDIVLTQNEIKAYIMLQKMESEEKLPESKKIHGSKGLILVRNKTKSIIESISTELITDKVEYNLMGRLGLED